MLFLICKDETFETFEAFVKRVQNKKRSNIVSLHTEHGGEFKNHLFESFGDLHNIEHNFSTPYTPQQNSVME